MPVERHIPVAALEPPDNPQREDTLMEGMDELCESLSQEGQIHNIVVEDLGDGRYKIVAGHRRSIAATLMKWEFIRALVYQPGEADLEMIKAHENFHRTQLNPLEEARYYARLRDEMHLSVSEIARRCRRSRTHVAEMLDLIAGDPEVAEALRRGEINRAQATEINKFTDEIGRKQALTFARSNGLSALYIRRWREERERAGLVESAEQVREALANLPTIDYSSVVRCHLHNEYVNIADQQMRPICNECWDVVLQAMSWYHDYLQSLAEEG